MKSVGQGIERSSQFAAIQARIRASPFGEVGGWGKRSIWFLVRLVGVLFHAFRKNGVGIDIAHSGKHPKTLLRGTVETTFCEKIALPWIARILNRQLARHLELKTTSLKVFGDTKFSLELKRPFARPGGQPMNSFDQFVEEQLDSRFADLDGSTVNLHLELTEDFLKKASRAITDTNNGDNTSEWLKPIAKWLTLLESVNVGGSLKVDVNLRANQRHGSAIAIG